MPEWIMKMNWVKCSCVIDLLTYFFIIQLLFIFHIVNFITNTAKLLQCYNKILYYRTNDENKFCFTSLICKSSLSPFQIHTSISPSTTLHPIMNHSEINIAFLMFSVPAILSTTSNRISCWENLRRSTLQILHSPLFVDQKIPLESHRSLWWV